MILQYTGGWNKGRIKLLNHPVTGEEIHLDSEQFPLDPTAPKLVEVSEEGAAAILAQYPQVFHEYTEPTTPATPEIPSIEPPPPTTPSYEEWAIQGNEPDEP